MKNKKLSIQKLEVTSFVTEQPKLNSATVKGGSAWDTDEQTCGGCHTDPFCTDGNCEIGDNFL